MGRNFSIDRRLAIEAIGAAASRIDVAVTIDVIGASWGTEGIVEVDATVAVIIDVVEALLTASWID